MKKFKVIEQSRFLAKNGMDNTKGGFNSCDGMHQISCSNLTNHATCESWGGRYLWGDCVANHFTCGLMTAYTEFCLVFKACGLRTIHGPKS